MLQKQLEPLTPKTSAGSGRFDLMP